MNFLCFPFVRRPTLHALIFFVFVSTACVDVRASDERVDPYLEVAQKRSTRIVEAMSLEAEIAQALIPMIADYYTSVHRADAVVEAASSAMKALSNGDPEMREAAEKTIQKQRDERVRDLYLVFVGRISALLDGVGVEAVKNGITYGRMTRDTGVFRAMLPDLSLEERTQVDAWLWEAREHALCAGSSEMKHWWFDKYRGRINNYLAARGYDLKAAELRLQGGQ